MNKIKFETYTNVNRNQILLILERLLKKGMMGYEIEIAEGQVERYRVGMTQ
jgi:hypothetical protein